MARNTKVMLLTLGVLFLAGCARSDRAAVRMDHPHWKRGGGGADQRMRSYITPDILPKTHLAAAQLLRQQGSIVEAIVQYRKAIALNHNYAEAYHHLGVLLSQIGRREEAATVLGRVVELRPNEALAQNNFGYALMRLERWEQAAVPLRRAVQIEPQFARAQVNLGMVYSKLGRFEDALASFRTVLPEPDAQYNLGLMFRGQQQYEKAATAFERALSVNPDFTAATTQLAQIAERLPRPVEEPTEVDVVAEETTIEPRPDAADAAPPTPTTLADSSAPSAASQGDGSADRMEPASPEALEPSDETGESSVVVLAQPEPTPVDEDGFSLFDEDGFPCNEEKDEEADFAVAADDEFEPVTNFPELLSDQDANDVILSSTEGYVASIPVDEDGFPLFDDDGFPCNEEADEEVDFAVAADDEFEPVTDFSELLSDQDANDVIASSTEGYVVSFPVDEDGFPLFDEDGFPCNEETDEEVDNTIAAADELEPAAQSRDSSPDQRTSDVITPSIPDNVATSIVDENGFPLFGVRRVADSRKMREEADYAVAVADELEPVGDSPRPIVSAAPKRDEAPIIEFPGLIDRLSNDVFFAEDDIFENDFLVSVIPTTPLAELGPFGASTPDEDDEPCRENEEGIPPETIALRLEPGQPVPPVKPEVVLTIEPVQVAKRRAKPSKREQLQELAVRLADVRAEIKCFTVLAAHEPARDWLNVSFADAAVRTWPELMRGIVTLSPISPASLPERVMSAKVVTPDAKPRKSMAMTIVPDEDESSKTAPGGFEEPKTEPEAPQPVGARDAASEDDRPPDRRDGNPHAGLTFDDLLDLLSIASNDLACWRAIEEESVPQPKRRKAQASAPQDASTQAPNAGRKAGKHPAGVARGSSSLSAPMPRRFRLGRNATSPLIKPRRD